MSDWYCRRHLLLGYCLMSLDGEDSRITRFLQESLHTNPFRKIPDYNSRQFTFFKQYFTKSVGPGRFSAENLKVIWQTDELIWGGLGNLRFLQVNILICCGPELCLLFTYCTFDLSWQTGPWKSRILLRPWTPYSTRADSRLLRGQYSTCRSCSSCGHRCRTVSWGLRWCRSTWCWPCHPRRRRCAGIRSSTMSLTALLFC
jgi:hypothetical protein